MIDELKGPLHVRAGLFMGRLGRAKSFQARTIYKWVAGPGWDMPGPSLHNKSIGEGQVGPGRDFLLFFHIIYILPCFYFYFFEKFIFNCSKIYLGPDELRASYQSNQTRPKLGLKWAGPAHEHPNLETVY